MKLARRLALAAAPFVPQKWHLRLLSLPVDVLRGPLESFIPGYKSQVGPTGALHSIPRGIAWSRGAHFDSQGRLLHNLSPGLNRDMEYWLQVRGGFFPRVQNLEHEVVSLVADGHANYFHWLFGVLPLLEVLDPASLPNRRYLACCDSPFQLKTLELLGIPNHAVIPARPRTFYRAPVLQIPATFSGPTAPTQENMAFLHQRLVENPAQPLPPSPAGPRFYISRRNATSRRLANESALLKLLEPLGFDLVNMEDFSVSQQISLFHHAEAVISPTGAALANLAFCRPGTRVLIFMPAGCEDYLYRDLAQTARLDARLQWVPLAPGADPDPVKSDFILDSADLESVQSNLGALGLTP